MLVEKEAGMLCPTEFSSLWVNQPSANGSASRYYNTVTKATSIRKPNLSLGGILADVSRF